MYVTLHQIICKGSLLNHSESGVLFHLGFQLIAWDPHNTMENNLLYSVFTNVYDNCILSEVFRIWLNHMFLPWLQWIFPLKIIMLHRFGNYFSRSPVQSWYYKAPETIRDTNQGERECKVNSAIEKCQQIVSSTNMIALSVP